MMTTIKIRDKEYEIVEKMIDQVQLNFYKENPRIYTILRESGTEPTDKEIEDKLKKMDHVKTLKTSIEQNGGLIDPLIVLHKDHDYIVLEGNSRLAAYRILAEKDPVKWQKIKVNILTGNITDGDIFSLLGQYHLIGRTNWNVFEKAAYLYRQKEASSLEDDTLAKNIGLSTSKVKSLLEVYKFMIDHNDLKPDRWSYYEEYLKNRSIKKYRDTNPKLDDTYVKLVKTGEIKKASDTRDLLGGIAKIPNRVAKKVMQDFINEKVGLYEGYEKLEASGKTGNGYEHLQKFRKMIQESAFQQKIILEGTNNRDVNFELKKIRKEVEALINNLDGNN